MEACLPNDYIKSCASLDVCRQVVCLMDVSAMAFINFRMKSYCGSSGPLQKTQRGRVNFNDFKVFMINLKTWQGVFKIHTKEKSGILRAERLRDALYDIGFQLSTDIISILILRYMRRDGTLRLGDFVSAILHLTMAFGELLDKARVSHGISIVTLFLSVCCRGLQGEGSRPGRCH